jgi:CRP/FNR family transcriptional regulator, cyclic AMP receptor protein
MDDDLKLLASIPLFQRLDRDRLERLADRSRARSIAAGDVVISQGRPADQLIMVGTGTLGYSRDTMDGRRLRLGAFAGPCIVDKTAVLDGREYTATWTALTAARVFLLPSRDFHTLLDQVPGLRVHIVSWLTRQLRDQQDDLLRAHFTGATTRTAAWLVRAAAGTRRSRIALPGAQQGLAETLGSSRVTINRALHTLAREGLIQIEPAAVVILAPERLAQRAEGWEQNC